MHTQNFYRSSFAELNEMRVQDVVSYNVKNFISKSGYTAEQLSTRANLSIATINRLKAGEHISIQGICALAEALDRDPLSFFQERAV